MPNSGRGRESKEMLEICCSKRTVEVMEKRFNGQLRIRAGNVELRSVTGRQKYDFVDTTDPCQPCQRIGQCRARDSKTLSDCNVRSLMTDAEAEDIHLITEWSMTLQWRTYSEI